MPSPPPVNQLVVLAHPDPNSFCAGVARHWVERAQSHSQTCGLRDLYADRFDPVIKLTELPGRPGFKTLPENFEECLRLQELDVLVFVYPLWFGSPPAMLKGYLERVVGSGMAFGSEEEQTKPLGDVRVVQIATSASSKPWLAEKGIRESLHMLYDRYLSEVFGAREVVRLHLDSITGRMGEHHATTQLARVDELAEQICAKANADRWDRARTNAGHWQGGVFASDGAT